MWSEPRRLTEAGPQPSRAAELLTQAQPQNLRLLAGPGRPARAQPPISGPRQCDGLSGRTKLFPFEDGTFDYVYRENMIEHIPWTDEQFMLAVVC